jgi:DNA-binding transcriptional MerR regulator
MKIVSLGPLKAASLKTLDFELVELLFYPQYTSQNTSASYRQINHWTAEKLLDDNRMKDDQGWRKLCLVDLLWIEVIKMLRNIGFSTDDIREVKQSIFNRDSDEIGQLPIAILLSWITKTQFYLVIEFTVTEPRKIMGANICDEEDYLTFCKHALQPFFVVSLKQLWLTQLLKYGPMRGNGNEFTPYLLTESEQAMMDKVRHHDVHKVEVQKKNGNIVKVLSTMQNKKTLPIGKLMEDIVFGKVTLSLENGRTTYSEITVSEKFNEK